MTWIVRRCAGVNLRQCVFSQAVNCWCRPGSTARRLLRLLVRRFWRKGEWCYVWLTLRWQTRSYPLGTVAPHLTVMLPTVKYYMDCVNFMMRKLIRASVCAFAVPSKASNSRQAISKWIAASMSHFAVIQLHWYEKIHPANINEKSIPVKVIFALKELACYNPLGPKNEGCFCKWAVVKGQSYKTQAQPEIVTHRYLRILLPNYWFISSE